MSASVDLYVESNRGLDGRLLLYPMRVRDCQWQGDWFNIEVLRCLMRSMLSFISAPLLNCGQRVKFAL